MRKILSLLLVPLLSLVIFLASYVPAHAVTTCSISNEPGEIAPGSSFSITITGGPPGATIFITIVETDTDTDTGITEGTIFTNPSGQETVRLSAPTSEGRYTIQAHRDSIDGTLCDAKFFDVRSDAPTVSDPNAPAELGAIVTVIKNIIRLLVPIAALAFFIMLLVGGVQFIFSGGDPKAAAGARNTLTYAIIGIILVVVSWLILLLVQNVTNVDVTNVFFPTL